MYENGNLAYIWSWNALQTIGISLLLLWPLLKTSKTTRLLIALFSIVINQIFLIMLTTYNGNASILGIINFFLFYPSDQYIILNYFGILVIGSVIGDIIFEVSNREESQRFDLFHSNKGLFYALLTGICIIIFGLMFQFPNFLIFNSISSIFYSIGIIVVALIVLIIIEEMQYFKPKKSYRYLYFYSYYSFTIFLGHDLLLMLFYHNLDAYLTIWIAIIMGNILLGILFRTMYKKTGPKLSLKALISILSFQIVTHFNKKKHEAKIVQ